MSTDAEERSERIQRGRDLEVLISSPGWKIALDILDEQVEQAQFQLINCQSSDADVIRGLHRRARAYRELFDHLQSRIGVAIEEGREAARPQPEPSEEAWY